MARLRPADAIRLATGGLRARRVRSALSALGIAIAVAAVVAVLGIARSTQADLLTQLGEQGNLLTVASAESVNGRGVPLPLSAEPMIARIPPVRTVTAVATVENVSVRRSRAIPAVQTGGMNVLAAEPSLPAALSVQPLLGRFLDGTAEHYPVTVLGFEAARILGIGSLAAPTQILLGEHWFTVAGVLAPVAVAPEIDLAALITFGQAGTVFGRTAGPSRIYLRADPDQVAAVAAVLTATTVPDGAGDVQVRRPSDLLVARIAAKGAFVGLFLGLGGVALLIAGVGIANIMVISVLERRGEIGLRRALGARRRHVAAQFLLESTLLATIGGVLGIGLGVLATAVAARLGGNPVAIPPVALAAGLGAALLAGALAGLYPAIRAARLSPVEALRSVG
ncbi:putative ABC transport system permease protein [Actinoplanes tereljensis]|uniref:ABC transporter permease n=1 Tax=Paractinoplanes tereljensis TaxID=571912 RepID=A0A919NMZ7_9ACTN|nr:ABC transporter permease [Actinoplanes tereljensis]GIF20547.1 ABC transporter permease [Actinoplanes tereljensis]